MAEAREVEEWAPFRRALPRRERRDFDGMLETAKLYASASSAAVRTSRFEGMVMALVFHHQRLLAEITRTVDPSKRGTEDRG